MKKITTLFLFSFLIGISVKAQQTGSFNAQITFAGNTRTLSCYVPSSYNAAIKYKLMVGLHGLGDNSTNYRNALINSLAWQNNFPNTIFVFPDGGADQNRDFYAPAGDEAIIDSAIQYAMVNYSIDTNYVVLQGYSLGGRSAIKFGLENPTQFKGLFLVAPAFQGKRDADNDSVTSLVYNYANASQVPIYITVGDQDVYFQILNPLVKNLKKQNAKLKYVPVAGVGHTIPSNTFTSPSFPFFENALSADYDVDLFDIDTPQHTCDATLTPTCYIRNLGGVAITSVDIAYDFSGNMGIYTWQGNLAAYQSVAITLSAINAVNGSQDLELTVGAINTTQTDGIIANNQLTKTIEVDIQTLPILLSEDFENDAPDWVINESGSLFNWYLDTDTKQSGTSSIGNFGTVLLFYTRGNVESFESPVMDLSTQPNPVLTYDIAYNYHKYTPPYFVADTIFADTLEVVISIDCGTTWQSLYKKGGAELATTANPILNPLNLTEAYFNPTASEWRKDAIDLSAFGNETEAILKFNYISDNGGSINIDNIAVNGKGLSLADSKEIKFEIFPNPAKDIVNIKTPSIDPVSITVYDISGNKVLAQNTMEKRQQLMELNVAFLPTGVYSVGITSNNKTTFQKLVISK